MQKYSYINVQSLCKIKGNARKFHLLRIAACSIDKLKTAREIRTRRNKNSKRYKREKALERQTRIKSKYI
jgi:hypothetical protein